ncbi:ArsA family ATPase [Streptomyces sp. ME19-01-6]|uniref:ArsA family ATPase n=1 Tax=Streptomyces sp. ME19-01-6 TaxID=3028686 RepID=UPI0029B180AC|nr:ArsA-related P-loop ATPase [Streptomyces sp. ME19-01-6]MDX3232049.1 ArsA-related P-loop ATPase [Streptomyces sp. ME19-01-6]
MRTVLVTGTGGAGRTTVAAATALAAAREGRRALLLTADRDGTPEALLGLPAPRPAAPAAERLPWSPPVEAAPGLWAAGIAADAWFRGELAALQERGRGALDMLGATPLDPEELTGLPGTEAFAVLRALRAAHEPGAPWDVLVVDMPPAPDTIAVLALPEQLRRYLRRLLPAERQAARALRPMLAQLAGVPMPAQKLYETAERWERELAGVQALIESEATTVRLVVDPGPLADRALRTARAGLALYGCRVEAVVANRLLPTGTADPWLAALSGQQQAALKELHGEWAPDVPVRELPHLGRDPLEASGPHDSEGPHGSDGPGGAHRVAGLAALAGPAGAPEPRPDRPAAEPWTVEDRLADEGELVWRLPLPGADRDGLGLVRRGDELIVTVGPFHRVLPLPSALRRCAVSGAGLRDGRLHVRFAPDPELWPKSM